MSIRAPGLKLAGTLLPLQNDLKRTAPPFLRLQPSTCTPVIPIVFSESAFVQAALRAAGIVVIVFWCSNGMIIRSRFPVYIRQLNTDLEMSIVIGDNSLPISPLH